MSDTPGLDATPSPAPAPSLVNKAAKRVGRPPGSKTNPAKKAAAAAKRGSAATPRTPSAAEALADAIRPPEENKAGRPSQADKLAKSLALMYTAIGGVIGGISLAFQGEQRDRIALIGDTIRDRADECGRALAAWAETNAAVKRMLTSGSSFGALAMVLAAHAPIGAALIGSVAPVPASAGGDHPEPGAAPVDPSPFATAYADLLAAGGAV